MPMPANLAPPTVDQSKKQQWKVSDIIKQSDLDTMKKAIEQLIPPESQPSPSDRVNALKYIDCPPGSMPRGYEAQAAKVESTGEIYFNNMLDDYFDADGGPNINKIKTTLVHESMHFVSAHHTGLQNYADLMSPTKGQITVPQHQPDEAITDFLAVQVYEAIFGKDTDYITAYWVPASEKVASATNNAKKELAQNQRLPALWTGEMVGVMKSVLGVDEHALIRAYFQDPNEFGRLIAGKEDDLKSQWDELRGRTTLKTHGVLSPDYKDKVLDEVIASLAGDLDKEPEVTKQVQLVRDGLAARNVGDTISPTSKAKTFSDVVITKRLATRPSPQTGPQAASNSPGTPAPSAAATAVSTPAVPAKVHAQGTAVVATLPPRGTQITEDIVAGLVAAKQETDLKRLYSSNDYPIQTFTADAWSRLQDWAAGI